MALIGISGKIGSGKDTVGKIIQYLHYTKHHNVKDGELIEKVKSILIKHKII